MPSRPEGRSRQPRELASLASLASLALLVLAAVLPAAAAHHPGSNGGLAALGPGAGHLVHRLPDVQDAFARWEAAWPGLVERSVVGATESGFPLEAVRITDESVPFDAAPTATGQKLRVYLDGGHHGNEYLGVELVMHYLEGLLEQAGGADGATLAFLREAEVHALPIVNVDGNTLDTRKNSRLVDPNRNYDFQWGGPGSSGSILDFTYRGPSPASEREVRDNMAFGTRLRPDVWVTMHTGIAEFYWPWGWTHEPAPDQAFFESLEAPFEAATNGRVDAMQAAELYLAAGATDDWAYGVLGVPAHTFEVHEDQFVPVYGEPISDVVADQLKGLDFVVRNVKVWGAWLEVSADGRDLVVRNDGWGLARNATLVGTSGTMRLPDIRPGGQVRVPAPEGALAVTYPQMLIATSKVRTVPVPPLEPLSDAAEVTPAPAFLLAAVALVALAARRRLA